MSKLQWLGVLVVVTSWIDDTIVVIIVLIYK